MQLSLIVFLMVNCFLFMINGSITQRNDDCTYKVETNKNVINVSCGRNVTVRVVYKNGVIDLSGRKAKSLWFETKSSGLYGFNKSRRTTSSNVYNRASSKLKDSTTILKRMKRRLGHKLRSLANITHLLENRDEELQQDLARMREWETGSQLAREATVAALTNQHNFLRMAMLAQNTEMKDLISVINSVITATQKSVRSSIAINNQLQEEVILLNTALTKANISKVEKRKDFCPRRLTAIRSKGGDGDELSVGIAQGTFIIDPIPMGKLWVTYGYSDINEIVEFNSKNLFVYDVFVQKHKLPFFCEGTGHIVYKSTLYCQKVMTNKIVKYNLLEGRWLGELVLEGAGSHNTYPYTSGKYSDVDFAVDEMGVWVIYATSRSHGNVVISKIHNDIFAIQETWTTTILKSSIGNSFMMCGILYAIDAYDQTPTYVKYTFDTNTGGSRTLTAGEIPFQNSIRSNFARNYMLDYNPLDRKLYGWNHGRIEIYQVFSEKDN